MKVNFHEISDAFDFVSFGSIYEHQAYLDRETGKIYYHSEIGDNLEELPEDIDSERYIAIPHKTDLNLGKRLVFNFVYKYLPDEVDRIEDIFSSKGAYSRYKSLLERKGMLDKWYEYETKEQESTLREWCELESIPING